MKNIFKHTSRTYYDVYNSLRSAYQNYPTWLFNEISAFFDFSSELINRIASDILYPKTRESAYGFASRCDYEPSEADGSTAVIEVTLANTMSKTIYAGYQFGGISSATGRMVIFEVIENTSVVSSPSMSLNVKQKQSVQNISLGIVSTQEDWMEFPIDGYKKIIHSSVTMLVDAVAWTIVDNFDNSLSTSKHFVLLYQSNGKARIQFGNGILGQKPTLNSTVSISFSFTDGLLGRLEAGEIKINLGQDTDIASLTNSAATSGGNDSESVASIIRNSRANVRLRGIVWSQEDLETASRSASSSVQKALGIPGTGTAIIHIIPSGGGNPSSGLKTQVQNYVQSLTQFGVMPVTASDPNYIPSNVTAAITVRSGFTPASVIKLVKFALTMATSAFDNQIIEYYNDNGIDKTRTDVINVLWAHAFTSADNDALTFIIEKWISLLGDREHREWGQPLEVGDLWIIGNSLYDYGVDNFSISSPTSNVVTDTDEIISTGTITVT